MGKWQMHFCSRATKLLELPFSLVVEPQPSDSQSAFILSKLREYCAHRLFESHTHAHTGIVALSPCYRCLRLISFRWLSFSNLNCHSVINDTHTHTQRKRSLGGSMYNRKYSESDNAQSSWTRCAMQQSGAEVDQYSTRHVMYCSGDV